jgi:hypothetical protein
MWHHVALVRVNISEECWFLQEPHDVPSQKMTFFMLCIHLSLTLYNLNTDSVIKELK